MIRALFAALTAGPKRGQDLFGLAVAEAGRADWFVESEVPDTLNGRFAVLATIVALLTVRLERDGAEGAQASVELTERMVESLDAELREMGLGDPTLGKQVRSLVGAVGSRVERWRELTASNDGWTGEVRRSLYLDKAAAPEAVAHGESAIRALWERLLRTDVAELCDGMMR